MSNVQVGAAPMIRVAATESQAALYLDIGHSLLDIGHLPPSAAQIHLYPVGFRLLEHGEP